MPAERDRPGEEQRQTGRRCTICGETWPDKPLYTRCPECGEETDRIQGASVRPLADDEAQSILLHKQFEMFYERWDRQHDPRRLAPGTDEDALAVRCS